MLNTPSIQLLRSVRVGFIQQGTSLTKWCQHNGVSRQWATAVLLGKRNGNTAQLLRSRLIDASRLDQAA